MYSAVSMDTTMSSSRFYRPLITLTVAILFLAAVIAVGFGVHSVWLRYNPFWDRSGEYQEVNALAATIHRRPLTDAEFARSLELCETGPFKARSGGVSLVEESIKLHPERGPKAVDVLARVSESSDAELSRCAKDVLRRINNAPPANAPQ
jgi:hypothetical protein